jgi:translation initiation factor 2 beta subunit (eIF-2beta)/eIF-5
MYKTIKSRGKLISGAYSMHREKKHSYKALTRKLERKGVIEKHRLRW